MIDNNYYYFISDYTKLNSDSLYNSSFIANNINLNELYNININLSEEDYILNNDYYNRIISKIGKDYICIFDDSIRLNSLFSFKYYNKIFNPNNYSILYFNESYPCNRQNNFYFINEILGDYKNLYYYHDIISNSKEVHFSNSFPINYFRFMFNILKDKFKDVKKYVYPRYISGINYNINNKFDININSINTEELGDFNNFKFVCPINFFLFNNCILNEIYDNKKYNKISIMIDPFTILSGDIIIYNENLHFQKSNKFINVIKKNKYYHNINYFNKFLINLHSINILGIADYNDIKKKLNPIMINLNENKIFHLWGHFEEIKINFFEDYNKINEILSLFLKNSDEYLNFIFLKSNIPFYLIINERELDNNYNIISNNDIITNYNENYAKLINLLMENKNIGYIFPYINDSEFELYGWYLSNLINN